MPYNFDEAIRAFQNDDIAELSKDARGLRFLKLRSLSRNEYMLRLIADHSIEVPDARGKELLRFLFESNLTNQQIEHTIRTIYAEERGVHAAREDELVSELYKMKVFDWGGLHQNSLEKTIVDNYVKKIQSFDKLEECIQDELFHSMRGYVLCSWYNHWTSIIIEDIFRDHKAVLPAVGLIKKVDFFIDNVPFDLKVTYLPEGYIKEKRRTEELRPELTLLKQICKQKGIHFDDSLPEGRLLEDLWAKVADHPSLETKNVIRNLRDKRLSIIDSAVSNPIDLIRWLYENQGVRRFDASNRLFLVLIDCRNFFDSWKLKRAKSLLVDKIHRHLDGADRSGRRIQFEWEGRKYTVTSDVVFVTHNHVDVT
jgi:hypothetical protein